METGETMRLLCILIVLSMIGCAGKTPRVITTVVPVDYRCPSGPIELDDSFMKDLASNLANVGTEHRFDLFDRRIFDPRDPTYYELSFRRFGVDYDVEINTRILDDGSVRGSVRITADTLGAMLRTQEYTDVDMDGCVDIGFRHLVPAQEDPDGVMLNPRTGESRGTENHPFWQGEYTRTLELLMELLE